MKDISSKFVRNKEEFVRTLESYLYNFYQITDFNISESISVVNNRLIGNLKDEVSFFLEYPYVDKMYRDTYYHYYASKNNEYDKNSIRISIFLPPFTENDIFNSESIEANYLGFFTIRPTFPDVLGRNIISPLAFKGVDNVSICNSAYSTTFNSLKTQVLAFPHASQDSEAITCAETTIWSIVAYFSNKYNDYRPLLPHQIHEILKELTVERQIPSKGLTAQQISFALKKVGFGVKVYNKSMYGIEFDSILKTYVDSGIPIVAIVNNSKGICHAFNIIGKRNYTEEALWDIRAIDLRGDGTVLLRDISDAEVEYVFIDDNCSPYRICNVISPCGHYGVEGWDECLITDIIVPLYPKIYMDAGQAKKLSVHFIKLCNFAFLNREIYIKTFLCSSRTYKDYLFKLDNLSIEIKKILLSLSMPKFIWITEIYDSSQVVEKKVEGIIILDATEPNKVHIIGSIIEEKLIIKSLKADKFFDLNLMGLSIEGFSAFNDNLTVF